MRVLCVYCFKRGVERVATTTVRTTTGVNTACAACAEEVEDALAERWDAIAHRLEEA